MEDICLENCDACEDLAGDSSRSHLLRSEDCCSYDEEILFGVIDDIFMSRESMVFTWSVLISSSFVSIFASSSNFYASILLRNFF